MATGGLARSESVGLLVPVTIWLTLTFIVPQLTGNLNPTAAINPIAALAAPPDTAFFGAMGQVLGSVSLADAYKFGAANLLDLLPAGIASPAIIHPPRCRAGSGADGNHRCHMARADGFGDGRDCLAHRCGHL